MRAIRGLLVAVLAVGMVSVVVAQQPGGFVRGGQQDVSTLVFTNAALQDDLKVTDAQKEKMKPVAEKLAEAAKLRPAFGGGDKEKRAEYTEKSKAANEEAKTVADETLTAEQKKRLHQISIQVAGFTALADPDATGKGKGKGGFGGPSEATKAIQKEVAAALKLTDAQRTAVKEVSDAYNKDVREIFTDAGIGRGKADPEKTAAAFKQVEEARKKAWGKVEEALDATQKTAWKDLVGEPFDLVKLRTVAPRKD